MLLDGVKGTMGRRPAAPAGRMLLSRLYQGRVRCRELERASIGRSLQGRQGHPKDTGKRVLQLLQAPGGSWRPFSTCTMQALWTQGQACTSLEAPLRWRQIRPAAACIGRLDAG